MDRLALDQNRILGNKPPQNSKGMEVCLLTMPTVLWIVILAVCAVVGFFLGFTYRKKVAEREIASAEEEAKRIINESIKSAESKKREMLLEAKDEIHKLRSEADKEIKDRRTELSRQERRIQQKEENLDKKNDRGRTTSIR